MANGNRHADVSVLVVGGGSIGQRHIMNLHTLGVVNISVCDPAPERRAVLESEYTLTSYASFEQAVRAENPSAILICTPPNLHVELAISAVQSGAHVFIEKPISNSMEGVDRLIHETKSRHLIAQVGYNWRFHDGLQKIKEMLNAEMIGRVIWARAEAGQYLPDWRPQLDYRHNYTARRAMGGGIILDGSHELDYMRWLLGEVSEVYCRASSLSDLEVDVEDTASIILMFESGVIGEVHLDFVQRLRARNCKIVGTEGTIIWDYIQGYLTKFSPNNIDGESLPLNLDLNAQYLTEMDEFLISVASGREPTVNLDAGVRVLQIAQGALKSAAENIVVRL